jgi:glutamyl-tRNA synthetase/glutamyl-Q tRNA(Asp) synthetase
MSPDLPLAPLTRFAPSPTGYLHLGHVVNAAWTWGTAHALRGKVLLRIEDHDRTRCRPAYEAAILDDLDWLGLEPDIAPTDEFRAGPSPFRQSDSGDHYEAALATLRAAGLAYVCACSRKDIAAEVPGRVNAEMRYPGTCRGKGLEPGPGRGWRVVMSEGMEEFDDLRLGPQRQSPSGQCGDLLVRDRLGNWTYQFAVTVDDMRHGIELVVRGEDLLESSGRQIRLGRMLGRAVPPRFLHHPLIRKANGDKLSKANRDTGIRELRAAGISAAEILGRAARLGGLQGSVRETSPNELPALAAEALGFQG